MGKTLKNVQRFDLGKVNSIERTPQGFLKIGGFATRTGVFTYKDANGKVRRELRHPEDVYAAESLETLKLAPFTIEHPPVMLTPDNVLQYIKGYTSERVDVNRDLIDTDVIVASKDAIQAVEDYGYRELSSGYLADIVEEHGTYEGAEYDYRQKNIKYNHLAAVRRGRAGPEVRLRLDSQDAAMVGEVVETPFSEFRPQGTQDLLKDNEAEEGTEVVVSGRKVQMPQWLADIWNDLTDRYDQMRGKVEKTLEEAMKHDDKGHKDADISQKNISPSVKVVQMAPDGRDTSGKFGPSDKMGPSRAKGTASMAVAQNDDEEEHGIVGGVKPIERAAGGKALADNEAVEGRSMDDDDEKKDDEVPGDFKASQGFKEKGIGDKHKDYEGAGMVGAGMSPADRIKHELEEIEAELKGLSDRRDALMAKRDEYASATMPVGEHKMDTADVKELIRARVRLERAAEKVLPSETVAKFDSMSDDEIRVAAIKHRHPSAELKGKSKTYIAVRFDSMVESEEELRSESVRREMGRGHLESRMDAVESSDDARKRYIQASREAWKKPLTAVKKLN